MITTNASRRQTACKTIGHAISLASSGDCIRVAPATYTENPTINFSLKIIGSNASTTIIDGSKSGTVVTINAGNFQVTLSKLTIQNGYTGDFELGGGIYNRAKLTVNQCTISRNSAGGGAGIANEGTLTINATDVSTNSAPYGGGILNRGTAKVNQSTIYGNSGASGTGGGGGGIENDGTMVVNRSTVNGNVAEGGTGGGYGGGIHNGGGLVVRDSTIAGNRASGGSGGLGGGIENDGTMNISGSIINANSVEHFGGGILNDGALTINNSTLSWNTASGQTCGGGGIANGYNGGNGTVTINNSTLSGNTAPGCAYAGGILGVATLQNSIVANSTPGGNCGQSQNSEGYNISDDNTCNFGGPGDMNDTNPELQPFGELRRADPDDGYLCGKPCD